LLQDYGLIESDFKVISMSKIYSVDRLTSENISEGFIIYEKLSI